MAKRRTAILYFVLWLAIFRVVLNQWYLLHEAAAELGYRDEKLQGAFDYRRRHLRRSQRQSPARFLMGIFTVQDRIRLRDAIRRSLKWYNDSRVCAIDFVNGTMPLPPAHHCQIIYTFVMGANGNGTTQIFANNSNDAPILTKPPKGFNAREPNDITFLNIKENMNEGKSPTWFNYASRIMSQYDLDYAIKCDMDTALRVDMFFDFADDNLPRGGSRIYSGKAVFSQRTKHPYMEGQFYLLSRDLTEVVGTMPLNKTTALTNLEDADIGSMVRDAFPSSIHYVPVIPILKYMPWRHPLKGDGYHQWFLQLESIRLCGKNDNDTVAPVACHPPISAVHDA